MKIKRLAFIMLILLIFAACKTEQPSIPESSLPMPSTSQPQSIIDEPVAGPADPEVNPGKDYPAYALQPVIGAYDSALTYYHFDPATGYYRTELAIHAITPDQNVFQTVIDYLDSSKSYPTISISGERLMLNWPASIWDKLENRDKLVASLATTLLQNSTYKAVSVQVDGQPQGIPELKFDPVLQEEYAKARTHLVYEPFSKALEYGFAKEWAAFDQNLLKMDATAQEIAATLYYVGPQSTEISSPKDLEQTQLLANMVENCYRLRKVERDSPELKPLTDKIGRLSFDDLVSAEAIETHAKALFGNYELEPLHSTGVWYYHPELRVFTPPHMGGSIPDNVLVLSYQNQGDLYTAKVLYFAQPWDPAEYSTPELQKAFEQEIRSSAHYEVTLQKTAEGMHFVSSKPITVGIVDNNLAIKTVQADGYHFQAQSNIQFNAAKIEDTIFQIGEGDGLFIFSGKPHTGTWNETAAKEALTEAQAALAAMAPVTPPEITIPTNFPYDAYQQEFEYSSKQNTSKICSFAFIRGGYVFTGSLVSQEATYSTNYKRFLSILETMISDE